LRWGQRAVPELGDFGVLQGGARVDRPLVDGDPTQDIQVLADPQRNFVVIIKDGQLYKNTLR
jgi:imidazolonepropionase-like amidohydrolase